MGDHPARHRRLGRLDRIWQERPIIFVTSCVAARRPLLDNDLMQTICREVWKNAQELYGWIVGRYVLMPDHVHFFCASRDDTTTLNNFVGKWKEWTAKHAYDRLGYETPLWQGRFFDHVLRSYESYEQKWKYVIQNPVRAGLVNEAAEWSFQGELNDLRFD